MMPAFFKNLIYAAAVLSALAHGLAHAVDAELKTFGYPRGVKYTPGDTIRDRFRNPDFVVRARVASGEWRNLFEHRVEVDWNNPQSATLVRFDFRGKVELAIQKSYGSFSKVAVRPAIHHIKPRIEGDTVYLTLDKPANLSIEFDGDKHHNLHVFAGGLEQARKVDGPDIVTFGPGIHRPPAGSKVFKFKSGQTILIDAEAVLEAGIDLDGVHDVTILGHGLIERPMGDVRMTDAADHDNSPDAHIDGSATIGIRNARNIRIEGLTIINPPGVSVGCMQSSGITITDVKAFSAGPWADGIDIYSCQDVDISRVFLRVSDDCFALYNHRWDLFGDVRRIHVTDSTCWADVAHAMYMGLFGNKDKPEVTEDVVFRNIDVLEINETQPRFQGVMAINANNSTVVRRVLFDDIRVDHMIEGKLFNFAVIGDDRFSESPGGGIENVTLRNITFTGKGVFGPSWIAGYDESRMVRGITLDNVHIGGKKIHRMDPGQVELGPHVADVVIR
ncbi:glycosyl hydrolase family 28 protein [Duganella radicis]|uniref:Glycoside hydrolase n=1 Tax=Duganella radicis TaxID=551988 RepID=A0A6L6PCB2_9BURK|nr:glycosyl hydrolase family 28 protein [Duganella radicis]MTV36055.1 hypothetical protein [Duganella radicis]